MRKITLFVASLLVSMGVWAETIQVYAVNEEEKYTSTELNALTEPTLIAIKNLSATNHYYFVGNTGAKPYSKAEFSEEAVFVLEPAEGGFYLKKLNDTYMQTTSPKDFGTKDNAALFTTTNPTSTGNGSTKFSGDNDSQAYINGNDDANLVRFVTNGKWINVQHGDSGTPTYNQGTGGWTIHYVYGLKFVEHSLDKDLAALVVEAKTYQAGASDRVGGYTAESFTALVAAIAAAEAVADAKQADIDALQAAIDGLKFNDLQPTVGAFYTIASNHNEYAKGTSMYAKSVDNSIRYKALGNEGVDASAVWTFEKQGEKFVMKNVATGSYLNAVAQSKTTYLNGAEGANVTISSLGKGAVNITTSMALHARSWSDWCDVVGWNSVEITGASAWTLAEVVAFSHTLTVGEAGWASLVLGFNAAIPAEVAAYVVSSVEGGYAQLTEVEGVLPANTAVLINAEASDYEFAYSAATPATVAANALKGTLYNKNVASAAYALGVKNDVVALYTVNLDQAEGTAFINKAYKAYLPKTTAAESISLRLEGATSIDNGQLTMDNESTFIYDLLGRRVEKMVKGVYIVNGKKVIK